MKSRFMFLAFLLPVSLAFLHPAGAAEDKEKEPEKKIKWGGRIQFDGATMSSDDPSVDAQLLDGTEFRRARLFASGSFNEWVIFKLQIDFADSFALTTTDSGNDVVTTRESPAFKDVFIHFQNLPGVGGITAGHFKEPFSLEEKTSSKYITFMERARPNVFAASRNNGLMFSNEIKDGRMTWAAGVFAETDQDGRSTSNGANYVARITGLPWSKGDGKFLHFGLSLSHRKPDEGFINYESRIGTHLAGKLINAGGIPADENNLWDAEVAWVNGRFSAQGEYIASSAETDTSDVDTSGYYAQVSIFVTRGDHRTYKNRFGSFGRVVPGNSFEIRKGGSGAVELALRYSSLDFSETVLGEEYSNVTFGANWYLNKYTRLVFNASTFEAENPLTGTVDADVYQARIQVEF